MVVSCMESMIVGGFTRCYNNVHGDGTRDDASGQRSFIYGVHHGPC
jgi:hypothetical protein